MKTFSATNTYARQAHVNLRGIKTRPEEYQKCNFRRKDNFRKTKMGPQGQHSRSNQEHIAWPAKNASIFKQCCTFYKAASLLSKVYANLQ